MKQQNVQYVKDSLCIILNHLLFVAAGITVLDLFQAETPKLMLWCALIAVPFFWYYITHKPQKLIPPPMFIILLGGMSLVEEIVTTQNWSVYYYIITFVYLVGYFVYYFSKQFLQFLTLNQHSASNIPEQTIFRNGIIQTLFFTACSSIILFVSVNFDWVRAIVERIWNVILLFLRYVLSGIDTSMQKPQKEDLSQNDPQMGSADMTDVIPEQILDDIRNLIIFFLCVAIVIGLILFLYYIYYMIKGMEGSVFQRWQKVKVKEDEDVREYCGFEQNVVRKEHSTIFRNNREKVRKLYQKKVLKRKTELIGEQKQKQLSYFTARECCDRLEEQALKEIYEKARYSEEIITPEDVRLAK
ncbi:MAG: cell envelope integrity protein TolA [Agathobacter sp.]|nr:cell envelope integrity protein TolA [Agathobacter sp.]